jgi:hypothetical protein
MLKQGLQNIIHANLSRSFGYYSAESSTGAAWIFFKQTAVNSFNKKNNYLNKINFYTNLANLMACSIVETFFHQVWSNMFFRSFN